MDRPYVVCHMLSTLDGRISGDFMGSAGNSGPARIYGQLRGFYDCSATLYGTVTMAETYAEGYVERLEKAAQTYPRTDYIASSDVDRYIVSVDTQGQLAWKSKYIEKRNRPKAHVIEVLTQSVSDDYLSYLHDFDISYIFAGAERLDSSLMMEKLKFLFGIEKLMVAGGGVMNGTLIAAGLVDEMSIVLCPMIEGDRTAACLADYTEENRPTAPAAFSLIEAKPMEDALWLRYRARREEV